VIVAVFVGAIVSAIMSTSDSILLGCGTVISVNLLPRVIKNPSEQLRLGVARWSVPLMAIVALYTAFNASTVISAIAIAVSVGFAMLSGPGILVIWWITVSLLTQQSDKPKPLTMADGQPLELTDRLGTLPLFRRVD
jgi:Na+/proline symporter